MGYMKEEKILDFLRDLKISLKQFDEKYGMIYGDQIVRYNDKVVSLEDMVCSCDELETIFRETDCPIEEFYRDPFTDVFIFCEGELYDKVSDAEAFGGDEESEALYHAFAEAAEKHGMSMEFYMGAFGFLSDESNKKLEEILDAEVESYGNN